MLDFNKKNTVMLQEEAANQILQNIFERSQMEPNTTPLEVLTSYSNYRKERFSLQRTIIAIIMVLFLMLPLLFLAPELTVTTEEVVDYTSKPIYYLSVDADMPVDRITATIDGHNIPVYEIDMHEYSVEPTINGRMIITVTLVNQQQVVQHIAVGNVDVDAPVLVSHDNDEENIYLNLSDNASGIYFEEIKAYDSTGNLILPASIDEEANRVAFAYPDDILNVYIPDRADNTLQLVLTIK